MPPAEKRRRCSYPSLERILCALSLSLCSCAVRPIVLFEKMRLRPPCSFLRRHPRGMLCYGLFAWARLVHRSPFVEVHDLSHQSLSSTKPKQPTDRLGGVNPIRNKYFWTSLSIELNRTSLSPRNGNAFLVIHFFDQSDTKSLIGSFFFFLR